MSDTPRTSLAFRNGGIPELLSEAKDLERELAAANRKIQRLVEAGDRAADLLACSMGVGESEEWANSFCQQHIEMTHDALGGWTAAKEEKV